MEMARYFLHLHECGSVYKDEEGQDCHDLPAARALAIEAAREMMCAEVKVGSLCLSCYIEIADAQGGHILTVSFRDALTLSGV